MAEHKFDPTDAAHLQGAVKSEDETRVERLRQEHAMMKALLEEIERKAPAELLTKPTPQDFQVAWAFSVAGVKVRALLKYLVEME